MKKLLLIALSLLLALGLSFALAEDEYTSGDYKYALLADGTAEITGYIGQELDISIPEEIDGYPVTAIGDYAFATGSFKISKTEWISRTTPPLTSVTLPDGLKRIGRSAFDNCTSLTSVPLPEGLKSIGVSAFSNCRNLTSISLPEGLQAIENYTFFYCINLSSVSLPENLKSIGDYAFCDCSSLSSISLPEGLKAIGEHAFSSCNSLSTLSLPKSLTTTGEYFFNTFVSEEYTCVALGDGTAEIAKYNGNKITGKAAHIVIPSEINGYRITAIECDAFSDHYGLWSVTIPESVTIIRGNPFRNSELLDDLIVNPNHPTLATINGVLFDKTEKKLICYPRSYTAQTYAVPQGIQVIGNHAFSQCRALTSVTLPESLTAIEDYAFYYTYLTSINLPQSIVTIGDYAFYNCALTSISLPEKLETIGNNAFSGNEFQSLAFHEGLEYIGDEAFRNCNMTNIVLPDSLKFIGSYAFSSCVRLTSVTLPSSLESIGTGVFSRCHDLAKVVLPEGLTAITDDMFFNCGMNSITLPEGVITIGERAFSCCRQLTSVKLPDSLTSIRAEAFNGCIQLTSIKLPENLKSIGDNAFTDCSQLASVEIPKGITYLGWQAFGPRSQTVLTILPGTYAAEWADFHRMNYSYKQPDGLPYGDLFYHVQQDGSIIIVRCETVSSKIDIPATIYGAPVTAIYAYAFSGCTTLTSVTIPACVSSIDNAAFAGCSNLTITVEHNSCAEAWCQENNFRYIYPDSNDWLFN